VGSKPKENSKYLISFVNLLFNYQIVEIVPEKKNKLGLQGCERPAGPPPINSKHEIH
jgi:hypothetical protein